MRFSRRLRKLVSVPRLMVLLVAVAALVAGTLTAVHVASPSGGSGTAGILSPGSQGAQSQGLPWWDPRGWFSSGSRAPALHAVAGTGLALPSRPRVLREAVAGPARRARELTAERTQYSRTYELSDGRRQVVISAGPVNYRDRAGAWEPISTAVTPSSRPGFSFADTANVFGSYFSGDPSRLVRFELPSGGWLQTGLPGGRRVAPRVAGNEVTYPGILPGVTLSYSVSPGGLKESVVLASPSADVAGLRFTVTAGGGLRPGALRGGATGWFRGGSAVPVLISPAPFMTDGRLPGGPGRAPVRGDLVGVAQRTSWDAARSAGSVVLAPDRGWLGAPGRAWPVTVDPTITIAPAPCPPTTYGCARNTFIESGANAGVNFYSYGWPLKVGTGSSSVDRALVQFPTSAIPAGSVIDSADLNTSSRPPPSPRWGSAGRSTSGRGTSTPGAGYARILESGMRRGPGFQDWTVAGGVHSRWGLPVIPDEWAAELRNLGSDFGDDLGAAAPAGDLGGSLPSPHLRLLQSLNGCTVYHGAFRLFGIGRPEPYSDLASWNASEVWRFAWDDRTDPYLMFGETAWGDQYAYRRGASGDLDQEVYFLEGTLLRPQVIAGSFEDFMVNEFLRNARDPYDELTIEAVQRRGPIDMGNHWVYVPSIALGGTESIDNVIEMPAVTAMTFAGDVASALRASRPGTSPTGVTPWTDDRGRARLKVVFA